jgi:hypothetical protein
LSIPTLPKEYLKYYLSNFFIQIKVLQIVKMKILIKKERERRGVRGATVEEREKKKKR